MTTAKQILIYLLIVLSSSNTFGQWDQLFDGAPSGGPLQVCAGASSLYQPKLTDPLMGMHLKFRIEDNELTVGDNRSFYYIGVSYFFKEGKQRGGTFKAIPTDASLFEPITVPYQFKETVAYFMLDVGCDYYLYSDNKKIFSCYAGWILGAQTIYYNGSYEISMYDKTNYMLQTETDWKETVKESIPNFKAGINLGIDVSIGAFGSIYFETAPLFNLWAMKRPLPDFSTRSNFLLECNLGFRYEFL